MFKRLYSFTSFKFVPKHNPPSVTEVQQLQEFVETRSKLFVLTGAGVSTESGIPDYRSEGVGVYARTTYRPMVIQEFVASGQSRKRYWARNFIGWPEFSSLQPNIAHTTLNNWQEKNKINCLVTQNVDSLHKKAGSANTIELHGTGFTVMCLKCDYRVDRFVFQKTLVKFNPDFIASGRSSDRIRPDGDIHLEPEEIAKFNVPDCPNCSGILKPDIVFFGDNVPKQKVEKLYATLRESDGILVLGSTLQVFSSYRFALAAKEMGVQMAIVTLGSTRADHLAQLKITARVGEILPLISLN